MTKKMELALRVPGLLLLCSLFTCQMNMICAQGVTLYPSSLSVHTDTFRLLLIPDQNTTASFNCSIQQVVTQAETTNSNLCFSGNQNTTSGWQLPSLVFSVPESSFSTMDVTLSTFPLTRLQETLVVWCCDSSNTLNINAAAIITVDVQPNIVVNANFSAPAKATIFPNPAYQNIAPCSCDLLQGACDVNCCCDSDCTPEDFSTFECLSGAFGGNFTVDDANLCGTQRFDVPDWHLFTCVERLNSPDLGLFYANTTGRQYAVSDTQFSAVASQTTVSTFSFADTPGVSSVQPPTQVTGYRNGDPVLIQLMLNGALTNGYLTLPQASLTGQCLRSSLVAFQNSSSSFCEVSVSAATNCLAGSLLDVNYYVTNTTLVLRAPSGGNAAVNVSYFRGQAADYVKTNSGQGTSTANSLFTPSTTASIDQPIAKPPTPTISGSNCSNAVASVTYVMTWESNLVTNLDVRVVVADVPLTGAVETPGIPPNNLLTQSFAVESQYFTQQGVKRSGNPGYDVGLPVISGIGDINVPTNPVDFTQQLKIWQPGASGLCADSRTAAPPYGQDTTSGCLLRVSLSEFRNCSGLRAAVEANQRALVAGVNLVSRYGSPNRTTFVADEWISVVGSLAAANASNDTILGQCDNIPSQMHIEFVTSLSGRIGGFPVTEIVGARISWTRETWKLQCSGGACQDDVTTESFAVYSTASFTSVPGSASTSDCSTDATCWAELLLPLTKVFYIDQSYTVAEREFEYNLVWALTVIYFSLGAALLTLNWNKIGKTVRSIFPV